MIAEDIVLTAGHCLVGAVSVVVFAIEKFSPLKQQRIDAVKWVYHKDYNGGYDVTADSPTLKYLAPYTAEMFVDLGLVSLPFKLINNPPMRISAVDFDPAADDYYIYVFGLGRKKDFEVNGQLHYLPLDHSEQVAKSSLYVGDIPLGSGWCTGDSGGPVSVISAPYEEPTKMHHYLVGVAFSFKNLINERNNKEIVEAWGGIENVPRCGNKIYYTRVAPHIPWIRDQIKYLLSGETRNLNIVE